MDKLEKEITELFRNESGFAGSMDESTRKEMAQMISHKFESDMSKVKIVFWIFFVLCLGMMAGGYLGLRFAGDTREMLNWVLLFIIGFNSTILMKLWYWVVNTKLGILKEIKQLQLQIAELADKKPPAEN